MGAEQSTVNPTRRSTKRASTSSLKYVPPSDGFLDKYTVYNHEKAYTLKELENGSKVLAKRLKKLEGQITTLSSPGGKTFTSVYEGIKDGEGNAAKASSENKDLNRYTNIVAYDASRVKVTPNEHNMGLDYVNANWIAGYKQKQMYIASQGPIPASLYSFWQMVVEHNSKIIVMVTNLTEGTRLKCHQYWPNPGQTERHGNITVESLAEDVSPLYVQRKFKVTMGETMREVIQFQYTAWPDHGVPTTTEEMLKFRHTVREHYKKEGPIVTHCSAGVGRTGTFIGLDRYLDSCTELDDSLAVLDIVKDMRKSRNYMVQAQAQFEYLYMACYDGLVVLLEKINRDLAVAKMSDEDRQVQKEAEIQDELAGVTQRFWARCHGLEFKPGQTISPDVTHTLPAAAKGQELEAAAKIKPAVRLESLAKSKEIWLERKNVPMSASEHGYAAETAKIEDRLQALGQSRLNWTQCYEEAVKTWQSSQDADGVLYDIGHQLTSLESRVSSLAAAESAWRLRGGSKKSVNEQLETNAMAELSARLESLQFEVGHADDRWRARGDGLRQPADAAAADTAHTVSAFGGLTARLQMLQNTQDEWLRRGNWSKFDDDKFFAEIQKIEEVEGAARAQTEKEKAAKAAAAAAAAAETKKERLAREKREMEEAKEAKKREKVKNKMREKSQIKTEWNAIDAKAERDAKAQAEIDAKQAVIDAAKAEEDAKKAKEAEAKAKKEAAAKKAAKFMKKK